MEANKQWEIIPLESLLWEITQGNNNFSVTAKTHKNLGVGGVYFNFDRYGRKKDYICGLRINGEYRTNLPFKKEIICKIRVIMEPLDKHPEIPLVEDCTRYEYWLDYKEVTREDFYHQDIENLCGNLVVIMRDYFAFEIYDKPSKVHHKIERGNKVITMGIHTYWSDSHLGYGWEYLLKPEEQLLRR